MRALNLMCHSGIQWVCDHLWRYIDPQKQYLAIQFDVTNACNLHCIHCYHHHHNNSTALSYEQWLVVLDQYEALLKKLHMLPNISICGGEPTTWPHLVDFIVEIRRRFGSCPMGLLSNGTVMSAELAQELRARNVQVQVSVDGPDSIRHDFIRGKGSFQKMLKGCSTLREYGVPFHHLTVLSTRTSQWIEDFFKFASFTGASGMNFVRLIVDGQAKALCRKGQDAPLLGIFLRDAMYSIIGYSRTYGLPTATYGELWHLIANNLGTPNDIGIASFVVDYSGGFKVSSRVSKVLGNVLDIGMEDLFLHHPIMEQLRSGHISICGDCQYYKHCRGNRNISFVEFGHFVGPDTGCWVLPNVATRVAQAAGC